MRKWKEVFVFVVCIYFLAIAAGAALVGTTFTYQGRLDEAGHPANGAFDFELSIFDDPGSANPLAVRTFCAVDLREGIFTLAVDFGPVFDGERRWVEVGVTPAGQCNGSTIYTYLDPRQEVTASPHAVLTLEALNADRLDGLDSAAFLRSTGTAVAEDLTLTGTLTLDSGAAIMFSDGTVQATAAVPLNPLVTHPEIFVPAFLTCGDNAASDPAQWAPLAIATFRMPLDASVFDVTANFAGIDPGQGMEVVAQRIQLAVRAATGGMETVSWDGRFIVSSALPTSASSIAPLQSTGFPVDISGAGADAWMDCEIGRGLPKEAVLDLPAYEGHLVLIDESGQIDPNFRAPASKIGVGTYNPISIADSMAVSHNLGRVPSRIRIRWFSDVAFGNDGVAGGEGLFDGSTYATVATTRSNVLNPVTVTSTTTLIIAGPFGILWRAIVGENAENHFRLDLVQFNLSSPISFVWEVE